VVAENQYRKHYRAINNLSPQQTDESAIGILPDDEIYMSFEDIALPDGVHHLEDYADHTEKYKTLEPMVRTVVPGSTTEYY
jgi:hypothetical protein